MENLSTVKKTDILPVFQNFLLEKKLVPEKNAFFYALWVSKYFTYARRQKICLSIMPRTQAACKRKST